MSDREGNSKKPRSTCPFSELAERALEGISTSSVSGALKSKLKEGCVHPLFHALLMKKRLPSGTLSEQTAVFSAGQLQKDREIELTETEMDEYWREDTFLETNDTGTRLAAKVMIELGGINEARWDYHKGSAEFAAALLNNDAKMVGEGIEVTDLPFSPLVEQKTTETVLVTRPESRGAVASAFARVKKHKTTNGLVTAITGPPGIGKSWTLLYVLQQALLYQDAGVIFFSQKQKKAYLFIRRGTTIYSWRTNVREPGSHFCELKHFLAVLDPVEADQGGAQLPGGVCPILYAASNNAKHFRDAAGKVHADVERYLGPPNVDQLKVILNYVTPDEGIEEAIVRTEKVNNLLRYIIDKDLYEKRAATLNQKLSSLQDENMKVILDAGGMSMIENQGSIGKTVPGTLFMVGPESIGMDIDDEKGGVDSEEPAYDGGGIDYAKRVVTVATNDVYTKVILLNRESIVSFWGVVYCDDSARMGRKIERLFAEDLKHPSGVIAKIQRCKVKSNDTLQPSEILILRGPNGQCLDTPKDAKDAWGLLGIIFTNTDTSAAMPDGFPLIDAAGPGRRVHQVTAGSDHSKSPTAMLRLLMAAGLMGFTNDRKLITIPGDPVKFYWVVPPGRYQGWTQKVAKKYKGTVPDTWDDGWLEEKRNLEMQLQTVLEKEQHLKAEPEEANAAKQAEQKKMLAALGAINVARKENWAVFCQCFHKDIHQFVLEMPLDPSFARSE